MVERTLLTTQRRRVGGIEFVTRYWREVIRSNAAADLFEFPEGVFPRLEQRFVSMEREPVIELLL